MTEATNQESIEELRRRLEKAEKAEAGRRSSRNPLPDWARELGERYRGGTISEFLVTGNVADVVPLVKRDGAVSIQKE